MQINRKDLIWNYGATFLKIASSVILLPLILRKMTTEMVGIWSVFMTISAFSNLLDFGFNSSFARNITYVFSGVNKLNTNGYESVIDQNQKLDYGLLKGVIKAMRWFYMRIAIILFLLLSTFGTLYINIILKNYKGDVTEIYIAWILLCLINTYNIFTLYYDSLLQGRGLVKQSKQIIIIGYLVYLIIASILIFLGFGIIAIVCAQISSVVIIRWLSCKVFFTEEIKLKLTATISRSKEEILKAIYPNAMRVGVTSLGGFLVQKSALVIGSLYLTLGQIAAYGISMQLIAVMASLASIYTATYIPKIVQLRVSHNNLEIKKIYNKGQMILFGTFILGGFILLFLGNWVLTIMGSKTNLMSFNLLFFAVILSLVETNLSTAGSVLLTKNEVPFFKASIISGIFVVAGLYVAFEFLKLGFFAIVLVPLIVNLSYQGWKWPLELKKDLNNIR
jgi:O-antigen/teichoic acid export membrane protein